MQAYFLVRECELCRDLWGGYGKNRRQRRALGVNLRCCTKPPRTNVLATRVVANNSDF